MYEVEFYEDKNGSQPVKEVLIELRDKARTSKDARIQYHKDTNAYTSVRNLWDANWRATGKASGW